MIRRYKFHEAETAEDTGLFEDEYGYWVAFRDYAALQAENERLKEENSLLTEALCEIDSLIDAHKGE